jgi:hypothetical protein
MVSARVVAAQRRVVAARPAAAGQRASRFVNTRRSGVAVGAASAPSLRLLDVEDSGAQHDLAFSEARTIFSESSGDATASRRWLWYLSGLPLSCSNAVLAVSTCVAEHDT